MATRYYIGIVEPGPQTWGISFPQFPGVISLGDSLTDVLANGRDALATVIVAMQEDGVEVPEDYTIDSAASNFNRADFNDPHIVILSAEVNTRAQRISVTMDEALLSRLDNLAERTHDTRSGLLAKGARLVLAEATA